ncbi:hypothetical protein RvY_00493-1 [Ramazzottius varieornatus]|uniref:Uncharacterized protein n=1 Tax=Ramazzottius varieornatus TaxID=947166 RepID=A0A1D1UDX3_RAMVA|nr:hypothetical protein RvY_00493-1 [Ramazzottius varieornatus]
MSKDFSDRSAVELAALMTNNSPQMECQICLALLLDIQLYPGVPNLPMDTELVIHRDYSFLCGKLAADGGCGNFFHRGCLSMVIRHGKPCPKCTRIVRNINLCPAVIQGTVDAMDIWTSAATALTGQLTLLHSGLEATRAQYAAVTAEREEVQRQNRRLLREVAALRRGTPYPVEQPPTSDASTSTEARVDQHGSTRRPARKHASTQTRPHLQSRSSWSALPLLQMVSVAFSSVKRSLAACSDKVWSTCWELFP